MIGLIILFVYVAIFVGSFLAVRFLVHRTVHDFTSLKTVTFGDESAVRPDRWASVISVLTIFLLWGAFTGSKWVPLHAPGPFVGDTEFTYTAEAPDGTRLYEFHPWEKNIALVPPYHYTDVSIFDYLQGLAARGEDLREYRTIWYYF